MTVPVPTAIPVASNWGVVDWLDQSFTSKPASGGQITLELPQLDSNVRWQLTHMVVGCTSSTPTQLRLYLGQVSNVALRDGSSAGNFDVADWPAGLMVPPAQSLIAVWTGASDGAIGVLTVQANIYRLAGT